VSVPKAVQNILPIGGEAEKGDKVLYRALPEASLPVLIRSKIAATTWSSSRCGALLVAENGIPAIRLVRHGLIVPLVGRACALQGRRIVCKVSE
jgi:hypothetical protein